MSLAVLASRALCGLQAIPVRVEVHMGPGLPAFHVVGLPDAGVRESRERVRAAIISSGFDFPPGRITVNLAPADLPKESGRFDLPIALGVLLASGQVQGAPDLGPRALQNHVFAGELSLTGAIVSVSAPLAIALAVARSDPGAVLVLPAGSAEHAARVPGLTVLAASSLLDVVQHFAGLGALPLATAPPVAASPHAEPCLSEVRGQALARRVLEVAAAGGHSLLMAGPPGTGKSMLAHRLPGLLPRLTAEQALEVAALAGISGQAQTFTDLPPFRAPHHTASAPALVGGGVYPRPGEISMAHQGVLFLDELPEFQRRVLESLREPLETGCVSIARASRTLTFPAAFQLVAAMNPCPCGWFGHKKKSCRCTPDRIEAYRGRLSGPLLDRVDLQIVLPAADADWIDLPEGESSGPVRARVATCRGVQQRRQQTTNARLDVAQMESVCRLDHEGKKLLAQAIQRWDWSARVVHRVLRVSRTLADLSGHDHIAPIHVSEAVQYRLPWR
ncbi:YifB family Mg chelatase-like AAA ATPase [Pusillimonas sp. SM2304]|uniref:YifB family Mg chelatase-like AAA ATPase n=1 Tax=Pusillimonas sp. SM2304 TaxID=3073241 RepID=UPI002875A9EA|nr:YifB family Mg chelatase-like AAA ATPase [Pusillimonas sp. SM2304]MDS1141682.1 YifB family Mg chelatase-like AAA ATPase [Pusillimonas sp. SM2304]